MRNQSRLAGSATALDAAAPAPPAVVTRSAREHPQRERGDRKGVNPLVPWDLGPASGLVLALTLSLGLWIVLVVIVVRSL